MGVSTYTGRAARALLAKTNNEYWVAIGRTSAWPNEDAPPDPSPGATDVDEAIVFVAASDVHLCKPVASDGDITHLGQQYAFVADGSAIAEHARFLYMKTEFHPSQGQPYGSFRQIGVFSNLTPATGYDDETWLAPNNVDDRGTLEYLDNDVVTVMSLDRYEVAPILIEFR